jgi:hypothetical protein
MNIGFGIHMIVGGAREVSKGGSHVGGGESDNLHM